MDQLTDFGRKLAITVALVITFAVLVALYRLVYLPLLAVEGTYWRIFIIGLAVALAVVIMGAVGWLLVRFYASARRALVKRGRPVYAKTKDGKQFVGWETEEGGFIPAPQPGFGANIQTLNMGHQAYPPKYLLETAESRLEEDEEDQERALLPEATASWEQEKGGMGPERFFLGWLAGGRKLWATFDQLLVSIAAGMQGFGKTTIARLLLLQHAMWGGGVVIYDAYNDLAREMSSWIEEAYSEETDVELSAQCVLEEVEARMRAWRTGARRFKPLLVVIDELTQYEGVCPSLVALIKQGSDVCRKARVRIFISVTRVPASSVGGRLARGNTGNCFLFKTMTKDLLNDFGIAGQLADTLHPLLFKQPAGYCVVRSGPLGLAGELLLVPDISPDVFKRELTWSRRGGASIWMQSYEETPADEEEVDFGLWRRASRRRATAEAEAPELPVAEDLASDRWEDGTPRLAPLPMKPGNERIAVARETSLSSLSAQKTAQTTLKRTSTPEERERESIIEAIKEHPEWSASRIFLSLGFRNNNKISLIKAIREELLEKGKASGAES